MNTYTLNIRSITAVLFAVMIIMFATSALPHMAFAQDDDGGVYADDSGSDLGSSDDSCCSDNGGVYADEAPVDNGGVYADEADDGGVYADEADNGGVYADEEDNGGVYADEVYDSTTPEYSYTDYSTDTYDTTASTYGTASTPMTISAPASYGSSSTGFSAPSFSAPSIPSAPIIQNVPIAYQQQQQQQQQQAPIIINQPPAPVVPNETCVNYSCNTTTSISNSGNTTTVIPITAAPVTYPVEYSFPQTYQNVSCSISAYPSSVQAGQYTYLTWQSSGATSATLTSYGNVAPNGSLSVRPYGSTNYVLTVYGYNGQTSTCNTYITVGSSYITPSVTLSQIPYTGFDFGTLGDTMYWLMLAVFALSAGYLLVYYKGGMGAFAGAMTPSFAKASKGTPVRQTVTVTKTAPVAAKTIEAPVPAKAMPTGRQVATLESLPAFSNVRPTSDSMTIASHDGAPRIVISRN
jgi:hypothetical protein